MQITRAFAIAGLAIALAGCGNSPEGAIRKFYSHVEDGEIKEAMTLVSVHDRELWGSKLDMAAANLHDRIKGCGGLKDIKIEQKSTTDSVKKYRVDFVPANKDCNTLRPDHVILVKEDGQWRLRFGY